MGEGTGENRQTAVGLGRFAAQQQKGFHETGRDIFLCNSWEYPFAIVANQSMPVTRPCPECGARLSDDARGGLCPTCALRGALALSPKSATAHLVERPGDFIGPYQLGEKLGEGGCGVVYRAEQTHPIRRAVALKIIKLGMDTRQVIARFEAERQILALLDHPHIAKVLDAGATEGGRPFFVMELVPGVRITDYCNTARLSTPQRLGLFAQVCRAVQHAHQKGIIHRDLKPSNILVAESEGVPVPKVIDFGIAKATDPAVAAATLLTATQQVPGTPAYMSPEQAGSGALDLDTRSDIYALGVLLYELLTGHLPFERTELLQAGWEQIRRLIVEREPPKPSTRLSLLTRQDLTVVAQDHGTEPPRLLHRVRGDLDWIVMKCLEKDRGRRYETASGLAEDLERHLGHQPVNARPPGRGYRFQKYVQRNKATAGFLATLGIVLLAGVIVSGWQALRATRAEREQARLRERAQAEARTSRQTAQVLRDVLYGVMPAVAKGRDTELLRGVIARAAQNIDDNLKEQPAVASDLHLTLSEVYVSLGDYGRAETAARRALELGRLAGGGEGLPYSDALAQLAVVLDRQGRLPAAEESYLATLGLRRKLAGNRPALIASSLNNLGNVLWRRDQLAAAEACYQESLALLRTTRGEADADVVALIGNLGILAGSQQHYAEAESCFRQVLAAQQKLVGTNHPVIAQTLGNLGHALLDQEKFDEAEQVLREALALRRKILDSNHPDLATALHNLGALLDKRLRPAEAETLFREALQIRRTKLGSAHAHTAVTMTAFAQSLLALGRAAEAEPLLREALAVQRKALPPGHLDLRMTLEALADTLKTLGQSAEAEKLRQETHPVAPPAK